MKHPLPPEGDTIAAIATPFGIGGLGVVRISGPRALEIAKGVFRPKLPPPDLPPRKVRYGHIVDPETGEVIDEVLVVYMKAPHTYTREDVVEISGHGGPLVLRRILEVVLRMGAREALPGEFTKRAFLNGRIDLSQAEAVLDLISAQSEQALKLAQRQLEGGLSQRVRELKGELLDLLVPIEAWLDLPEEDIPPPSREEVVSGLQKVASRIRELLEHYRQEVVYREGVRTALLGKANVGKSSIFNRLLGRERAIVTPIPGTTTDLIEETLVIRGIPFCLVDMAGLGSPRDLVEEEGMRRARGEMERAELLLVVLDGSRPLDDEDKGLLEEVARRGKPTILVVNKADLPPAVSEGEIPPLGEVVRTSALTGEGLEELKAKMVEVTVRAHGLGAPSELVPVNTRHKGILERALARAERVLASLEEGEPQWDMVALEIRELMEDLGEIVGETAPEEVLEAIFSRFCVGK